MSCLEDGCFHNAIAVHLQKKEQEIADKEDEERKEEENLRMKRSGLPADPNYGSTGYGRTAALADVAESAGAPAEDVHAWVPDWVLDGSVRFKSSRAASTYTAAAGSKDEVDSELMEALESSLLAVDDDGFPVLPAQVCVYLYLSSRLCYYRCSSH